MQLHLGLLYFSFYFTVLFFYFSTVQNPSQVVAGALLFDCVVTSYHRVWHDMLRMVIHNWMLSQIGVILGSYVDKGASYTTVLHNGGLSVGCRTPHHLTNASSAYESRCASPCTAEHLYAHVKIHKAECPVVFWANVSTPQTCFLGLTRRPPARAHMLLGTTPPSRGHDYIRWPVTEKHLSKGTVCIWHGWPNDSACTAWITWQQQ